LAVALGRLACDGFDTSFSGDRIGIATQSTIGLNGLQYNGSDSTLLPWRTSVLYLQIGTF
jgi:hypothetical protein